MPSTIAMTISSVPIMSVPMRVEQRVAGDRREPDAEQCEDETDERSDVFEQHDGQLGRLGVTDERDPRLVLRADVVALLDRRAQRERLEHDRDHQHAERDPEVLELVRVQ